MSDENILFIVNPHASGKKTGKTWEKKYSKIQSLLTHQSEYKIADGIGTGMQISQDAAKSGDFTMIVSVGGEGTSNEIVNGIYNSGKDVKLGFIRSGTVNDYLQVIKWPIEIEDQVTVINKAVSRPTPLTKATGDIIRYSLNIGDIGVGAVVSKLASIDRKLIWIKGQFRYTLLILRAIMTWSNIPVTILADKRELVGDLSLLMGGFSTQSGGYMVTPQADPFGDQLAYTIAMNFSKLQMIKLMGRINKGEHTEAIKGIFMGKADTVKIKAEEPILFEVDGEPFSFNSDTITLEAIPNAINILNPNS